MASLQQAPALEALGLAQEVLLATALLEEPGQESLPPQQVATAPSESENESEKLTSSLTTANVERKRLECVVRGRAWLLEPKWLHDIEIYIYI